MKFLRTDEHGNTSPGIALTVLAIIGIIGYLAFTSYTPENASEGIFSAMFATWIDWPWWGKVLSIIGPIVLALVGEKIDNAQGFTKL